MHTYTHTHIYICSLQLRCVIHSFKQRSCGDATSTWTPCGSLTSKMSASKWQELRLTHVCVYVLIHVCVYVLIHVCVYVSTHDCVYVHMNDYPATWRARWSHEGVSSANRALPNGKSWGPPVSFSLPVFCVRLCTYTHIYIHTHTKCRYMVFTHIHKHTNAVHGLHGPHAPIPYEFGRQ